MTIYFIIKFFLLKKHHIDDKFIEGIILPFFVFCDVFLFMIIYIIIGFFNL